MKDNFFKSAFDGGERRGYHHGRLKDALIEAARSLVAERGPAGFTLAELAKLVGVTGAAPYRHFTDRNAVMTELARRGFELFGQRLAGAWDNGRPEPVSALKRMGAAYLAFAREEPGLYSAMFSNVGTLAAPDAGAAADKALALLRIACDAVLRTRGGNPANARQLAFEIWAMSHGVAMLAIAGHLNPASDDCDPVTILENAAAGLIETAARRPITKQP